MNSLHYEGQMTSLWKGRAMIVILALIAMTTLMQMKSGYLSSIYKMDNVGLIKESDVKTVVNLSPTTPEPDNFIEHYVSVNDKSLLNLKCSTCALVTSGGQLLDSDRGDEIDSYPCVIRLNDSPTTKFQRDVGIKTTVRIVAFSSQNQFVKNLKDAEKIHKNERNGTIVVAWGPPMSIGENKPYGMTIRSLQKQFPLMDFYELDSKGLAKADDIYKSNTGINRMASGTWLSTGFFAVLFSREVCDVTHIYGMTDPGYCDRVKASNGTMKQKPYHYAGGNLKECEHFIQQKNQKHGHRFFIEKKLFKQWSETKSNIVFVYPEWI